MTFLYLSQRCWEPSADNPDKADPAGDLSRVPQECWQRRYDPGGYPL